MKITNEEIFNQRRHFLKLGAASLVSPILLKEALAKVDTLAFLKDLNLEKLEINDFKEVSNYINFYELSTNKPKAVKLAEKYEITSWGLEVNGEVENPLKLNLEDIYKFKLKEKILRFRCVEGWSMVVPWIGFEIKDLLDLVKPTKKAKFIKFTTLLDKSKFPDQNSAFATLDYPYTEALRLDEALNPLAILAVGMYGKKLPNQNGAPIRLVVPWKYGFKSIKSIVKIELTKEQPKTTWELYNPDEYGFYANVNPSVDHPRWSQAKERVLGEFFSVPTLMFNGYEKEVGYLYKDLDLEKFF